MGMKARIAKLEQQRATVELEAVFMSNMERLKAQVSGEQISPPHPRTNDPHLRGTFLDAEQIIVDEDGEHLDHAVEDLSE